MGCANGSTSSQSIERTLAADPRLKEIPVRLGQPSPAASPTVSPTGGLAPFLESPGLPESETGFSGAATLEPSSLATAPTDPAAAPSPLPASSEVQAFTDLDKAPAELRQSLQSVAELGVLTLRPTAEKSNSSVNTDLFAPNQVVTRRDYVRWLVAANNRFHRERPSQQIRLAAETAQPVFQDVPRTDPDFAMIQGLAEAGIIGSPLSGEATVTRFRPDAPLTRETLIAWKVPLDLRQALPTASIEAVKDSWGFQDAARIDPKALRAVLADFQSSDMANIRRVFGYTTLFQPKKGVSRAEAAASLWHLGTPGEGMTAQDILQREQTPAAVTPASPLPSPEAAAPAPTL